MKVYLDTSSLLKLYHREIGTVDLETIFKNQTITEIFLSEITKVEFYSSIWKKVRTKEITKIEAQIKIDLFEKDISKYTFISVETPILEQARLLILKYNTTSLRTLDSIQLATCISLSQQANLFLTADLLLQSLLKAEGLPTEL